MDITVLQKSMRFGGLLHGNLPLSPDSQFARGEERHCLIQGFGCTVGRTHRECDSQVSRMRIGERHHRLGQPGCQAGLPRVPGVHLQRLALLKRRLRTRVASDLEATHGEHLLRSLATTLYQDPTAQLLRV